MLPLLIFAFISGSLPFSVWIGRWFLQTDIRDYGDANPGATNVLRAGGRKAAALAYLLDIFKGAFPVGLAHLYAQISGWPLVAIALMPVLGHAFSPFLGWRGGKAVAVTAGIWMGLTIWEGPTIGGLALGILFTVLATDGWSVILAMVALGTYLWLTPPSWNFLDARPEIMPTMLMIWVGNLLILAWKHWGELGGGPRLRGGVD